MISTTGACGTYADTLLPTEPRQWADIEGIWLPNPRRQLGVVLERVARVGMDKDPVKGCQAG